MSYKDQSHTGTDGSGNAVRVHFPADQTSKHDAEIVTRTADDGQTVDVHLGFLQYRHRYQIHFIVRDHALKHIQDLTSDPLQNLHVCVGRIVPTEDGEGHSFDIEFKADKDKLMTEELRVSPVTDGVSAGALTTNTGQVSISSNFVPNTMSLTLILHARVLGKGKGTPALRSGITCVGVEWDEESECSDWQGFD